MWFHERTPYCATAYTMPHSVMFTEQQKTEYDNRGFLLMRNSFDPGLAIEASELIWNYLHEHRGVERNDPDTWNIEGPWVGLKSLRETSVFESLQSDTLVSAINGLLGADAWQQTGHWGGFLVSFPNCAPADWALPTANWHVDFQLTHKIGTTFGVQTFVYLTEVRPRGGGTLVVSGSHRLTERFAATLSEEDLRQKYGVLRDRFNTTDPWLRELNSGEPMSAERVDYFMNREHVIDGVSVKVEELCASPGDAVLVHPWLVHMVSPNAGPGPRFVLHRNIHVIGKQSSQKS
ncbi:MAG: hypothetical protein E2O78_03875 [Caldithrix sp.]|nr:MAG: hypothetical protein E2O78_03875 [Caldithrix sp.]